MAANRRIADADDDDDLDQALETLDVERNFLLDDDDVVDTTNKPTGLLLPHVDAEPTTDDVTGGATVSGAAECVPLPLLVVLVVSVILVVVRFLWFPLMIIILIVLLGVAVARTQIPPRESFHIKKEIKRIQRGKHRPQAERENSKQTWLEKKVTNVTTYLTTEAKDAVGGFDDVQYCDVGFGILVVARDLTTTNAKYYSWLGFLGEWRVLDSLSPETQAKLHQWLWTNSTRRS